MNPAKKNYPIMLQELLVVFLICQAISAVCSFPAKNDKSIVFDNNNSRGTNNSQLIFFGPTGNDNQLKDDQKFRSKEAHCIGKPTNYRYDLKSGKCFQAGVRGLCGINMIFYSINDTSPIGQCDCDYFKGVPLIYYPPKQRCYFIYQQGPCKEDEWLEINRDNGMPICKKNKCYNSRRYGFGAKPLASLDEAPIYVPLNGTGKCVQLNKGSDSCDSDEIVLFYWPSNNIYAQCSNSTNNDDGILLKNLSVPTVKCPPGSYRTILGYCQVDFDFD